MTCVICKTGDVLPGTATFTITRGHMTLVVKQVPARVCENCGEEYVDEAIAEELLKRAAEAERTGVQVEVREYAAV